MPSASNCPRYPLPGPRRLSRLQAGSGRGDLVFFKINPRLNHVGIYVGNGEFIHVSFRAGVTRSKLDNVYWRNKFWQARRIDI
jgi:cell wall-associated NlpC family hydrolase